MTLTDYLQKIADAIRAKDGTSDVINAQNFAERILSIPTGGSSVVSESGTFTVAEDKYNLTIPHSLGVVPDVVLCMVDDISNLITASSWGYIYSPIMIFNFVTASNTVLKGEIFPDCVSVTDASITFNTQYGRAIRSGYTYNWIVIGGLS